MRAACVGRRQRRRARLIRRALVLSRLPPARAAALRAAAPERITLASGRSVPVHYDAGDTPWIESRLQDFFGTRAVPALGPARVRADGAPAGAQRTRRAGDARPRELLDAALPGAPPRARPPLSQARLARGRRRPRQAAAPSSRRAARKARRRDAILTAPHAAARCRSCPDARARSAARAAGRAPRQPPGADRRGPPAPAQLRREPVPLSRQQPLPLPVRAAAAGRGRVLRRRGAHALPARARARPGAVGGRAAQPPTRSARRPAARCARWRACPPASAAAPSRRCPRRTSRPAWSRAACSAARSGRGVIDVLDAPLADAMIELRLRHDDAARRRAAPGCRRHRGGARRRHARDASRAAAPPQVRAAMEAALMARGMGCAYPSIVTPHGEVLHSERYDHALARRRSAAGRRRRRDAGRLGRRRHAHLAGVAARYSPDAARALRGGAGRAAGRRSPR